MTDHRIPSLAETAGIGLIDDQEKLVSSISLIEDLDGRIGIHQRSGFRRNYQQNFIGKTGEKENDIAHSGAGVKQNEIVAVLNGAENRLQMPSDRSCVSIAPSGKPDPAGRRSNPFSVWSRTFSSG